MTTYRSIKVLIALSAEPLINVLQVVDNGACELVGRCIAVEILCADFAGFQHLVDGSIDLLTVTSQVDVT